MAASSREGRRENRALVVLPIKSTPANVLAVTAPPSLPPQLYGRLTAEEFNAVVGLTNETLKSHGGHSVLSLLLPLLLVDLCSIGLIALLNPWLLVAPWDFALGDVALPISVEFILFFCMFPVMLYALNRRMSITQAQLRAQLDELTAAYVDRGVSFSLRQRLIGSARGSSLWLEIAVAPVLTALMPVVVPVPTLYPMLVDGSAPQAHQPPAPVADGGAGGSSSSAMPCSAGGDGGCGGTAAGKAPMPPPAASPAASGNACAGAGGGASTPGCAGGWEAAQAMSAQLGALHAEYMRVLHENQLLRAHLHQYQWQQCALLSSQQHQHAVAAAAAGGQGPFVWAQQQPQQQAAQQQAAQAAHASAPSPAPPASVAHAHQE